MIFIVDLNRDLNQWFKSFDLNRANPVRDILTNSSATEVTFRVIHGRIFCQRSPMLNV